MLTKRGSSQQQNLRWQVAQNPAWRPSNFAEKLKNSTVLILVFEIASWSFWCGDCHSLLGNFQRKGCTADLHRDVVTLIFIPRVNKAYSSIKIITRPPVNRPTKYSSCTNQKTSDSDDHPLLASSLMRGTGRHKTGGPDTSEIDGGRNGIGWQLTVDGKSIDACTREHSAVLNNPATWLGRIRLV